MSEKENESEKDKKDSDVKYDREMRILTLKKARDLAYDELSEYMSTSFWLKHTGVKVCTGLNEILNSISKIEDALWEERYEEDYVVL